MCNNHTHNHDNPFGDLGVDDDLGGPADAAHVATTASDDRPTFPCEHCGGTGRWSGGVNRHGDRKCFACSGKGHFLTSAADRRRARTQRRESAARRLEDAQTAFNEQEPTLIADLMPMVGWNSFAASLVEQFHKRGDLSAKQIGAAKRMIAKVALQNEQRAEQHRASEVEIDLSPIRKMFDHAVAQNHKKPIYRAVGLIINLAPAHGKNPGALYVKRQGSRDYQGKLIGNVFHPHKAKQSTIRALKLIAQNPTEAAIRYGRKFSNCSICARALTNKESIERGIGPVCAANFDLL